MNSSAHIVLHGSLRPAKRNAIRLRDVNPSEHIEVTLDLRGPKLPGADTLPKKAMTRDQFAAKYGADKRDADRIAKVLKNFGLKIEQTSLLTRSMRVSGSAADMERAFKPNLGIYRDPEQGEFRGREGALQIPAQLDGMLKGVHGLDDRRVARRRAARKRAKSPAGRTALSCAELENRYNFPPGTAAGQQIGIAEFGGTYFEGDLNRFCQKIGRPVPEVKIVPVGSTQPTAQQIEQMPRQRQENVLEESTEVMMDIQIVAGLCPASQVFVYFAPFNQKGWVDLLNKVMDETVARPVVLSVSWGLAEDAPDWSGAALTAINNRLQAMALMGITTCVSAGDDGSGDEETDGKSHVDFPASSPFALSVGGTMLSKAGHNLSEVTWWEAPGHRTSNGGGSTGGGVSEVFSRPEWQNVQIKSLNGDLFDGRVVPDIAALAGPPFYDLVFLGKDAPNGGTSASAPLWAALIARLNAAWPPVKRQRFLTPLLYQVASNGQAKGLSGCTDVSTGQNASHPPKVGYDAGKGYDAVSGWGVPNGVKMLSVL
ncbi:MAG: S8/S53 family peptidase [Deltaproteobacteria bacterium]|nr:S8/S53 family peptidase [Deltaproteobacteria bacterium]